MSCRAGAPVHRQMTTASHTSRRGSRSAAGVRVARAGRAGRSGVVYGVVGILALKLALGSGREGDEPARRLQTIAQQPFGEALLIATTIGLAGYSIWRLLRAALGHGRQDRDSASDRIAAAGQRHRVRTLCVGAIGILTAPAPAAVVGCRGACGGGVLGWPAGTVIVARRRRGPDRRALYQGYKALSHASSTAPTRAA